jgi:hypothetical protein
VTYLIKVPIHEYYTDGEAYALINPSLVSSMVPEEIEVGEETTSSKTIKGTRVCTDGEVYFVPLPPAETARLLQLDVVGLTEEEARAHA